MAIAASLRRLVPFASRKPKIERKQALAILPVRNALVKWERRDRELVLTIPLRDDRLARTIKKIVRNLPETRQLAFDEVGGSVWELCDGKHDVNSIVQAICRDFKLTRREAEASVTMFLQTLAKKRLIGLMSAGGATSGKRKR